VCMNRKEIGKKKERKYKKTTGGKYIRTDD
jgi:hypothetical protein